MFVPISVVFQLHHARVINYCWYQNSYLSLLSSPLPPAPFFKDNQRNPSPLPPSYISSLLIIFSNLSLPHLLPTHSKRPPPYFPSLIITQQANREE